MVHNNVIDRLTIGDYLVFLDNAPYLSVDLRTGIGIPTGFARKDASAYLSDMALRCFPERHYQIAPFTYRGTLANGKNAKLTLVRISRENQEQLCLQAIAAILTKAANPDPLEQEVRNMLSDLLDRMFDDMESAESEDFQFEEDDSFEKV